MTFHKVWLVLTLVVSLHLNSSAASAVAAHSISGAVVYAYGFKTEAEAKSKVLALGGAGFSVIAASPNSGYGAITRNFNWVKEPKDAVQVAAICGSNVPVPFTSKDISTCVECEYIAIWNDQLQPRTGAVSAPLIADKRWEHDEKDLFEATAANFEKLPQADEGRDYGALVQAMKVHRRVFRRYTGATNLLIVGNYSSGNHADPAGTFDREWYTGDRVGRWREYYEGMEHKPVSKEQYYYGGKMVLFGRELDPQGHILIYFETENDKRNGIFLRRNANGVLEEEGQYAEGKKTKTWKNYNPVSGMLESEENFENDAKTGISITYFRGSKNKRTEYNYVAGRKNGVCKDYYENGKVKLEAQFADNTRNGSYKEFYENGNEKSQMNYNLGILEGPATYYSESVSGKITAKGEYQSGRREGAWQEADATGNLKAVTYSNGQKNQ
ncbi:MAG: hypothetical protein U0T73_07565 [Chitinophagales bacterium]